MVGFFTKKLVQNLQPNTPPVSTSKVVAFLNQKGGVGKTTMAFNVAHALARQGQKVLCLDMDPQANLSLLFGIDLAQAQQNETSSIPGPYSVYHLLINSVRELRAMHVGATVSDILVRGSQGVDLLPAGQELSGLELSVAAITYPRQLVLKKFLEVNQLHQQYDTIIIDCPPTLGLLVVNVLCAANGVLVPFRPDEFSRKGLLHLQDMLADIEDMGLTQAPKVLGHIPNLLDPRRKQEGEDLDNILKSIREELGDSPVTSPFFNRAQLVRGLAQKKSVFDYESKEFEGLRDQFNSVAHLITRWQEGGNHDSAN